jgi:hypothetical protein
MDGAAGRNLTACGNRRSGRSRILRAPQLGFSCLAATMRLSARAAGWRIGLAAGSGRSNPPDRIPHSGPESHNGLAGIVELPAQRGHARKKCVTHVSGTFCYLWLGTVKPRRSPSCPAERETVVSLQRRRSNRPNPPTTPPGSAMLRLQSTVGAPPCAVFSLRLNPE